MHSQSFVRAIAGCLLLIAQLALVPTVARADLFCGWNVNDAVTLLYDPSTGELYLDVALDEGHRGVTTLEITSKSGLFTGVAADGLVSPPFDVFTSEKYFLLKTVGIGDTALGPALPPGLSVDFLQSDLSIDGSYYRGGSLRTGGGGGPYFGILECLTSGDLDYNQRLDSGDLDLLASAMQHNDAMFDLDGDGDADLEDWINWVHEWKYTWIGDADLNGEFNSSDLVSVFSAGTYEDGLPHNSTWLTGDWNGDFEFDTGDLVFAFQDGGYEQGTRDVFPDRPDNQTWFGDANLDGEFDTEDLVAVFRSGKYEDDIPLNADWADGDWNGDGEFDTADFILAFQDAGYESGPRASVAAVPEPGQVSLLVMGLCGFIQ
ncbi:MAG: hypothetical protein KDB23_18900, partial [Planctomycetales bacterium]|nr:hypothetical protein [Planctomycetales bacterium]